MQQLRLINGDIFEEGSDGGKARIAAPRNVSSLDLKVGEEVTDEVGINIGYLERGRCRLSLSSSVPQQETERIAVADDRIRASVHLRAEPFSEEPLQMDR